MNRTKWNRQPKRHLRKLKDEVVPPKIAAEQPFKVTRIRERKRKRKHEAYTITSEHKRWVFENNPRNNGRK